MYPEYYQGFQGYEYRVKLHTYPSQHANVEVTPQRRRRQTFF